MSTKKTSQLKLLVGAIGVVYGDIGTSALYTINELRFHGLHGKVTSLDVIEVISLVIWLLTILITIKYVTFVLRADENGEGGTLTLRNLISKTRAPKWIVAMLILAAGFLLAEGVITPAISVLSATEGLKLVSSELGKFSVPLTIVILTCLFVPQFKGTETVGKIFGPLMVCWFVVIGLLGVVQIANHPQVLVALNPIHVVGFFQHQDHKTVVSCLGFATLAITGGEALFADLSHFGKGPIQRAWLSVVYPALICNYLGQGAFLLSGQEIKNENIFFSMVPSELLIPMVILATLATVIASQALITGSFSIASQAISQGLLPRMQIKHTSEENEGQIYIGIINWLVFVSSISLVLVFRSSANLAAAYGLAVTFVMACTSLSCSFLGAKIGLKDWQAKVLFGCFGVVDIILLASNSTKLLSGAYVPLGIGSFLFFLMATWSWGRRKIVRALPPPIKKMSELDFTGGKTVIVFTTKVVDKECLVPEVLSQILEDGLQIRELIFLNVSTRKDIGAIDGGYSFYAHSIREGIVSVAIEFGFAQDQRMTKQILEEALAGDLNDDILLFFGSERIIVGNLSTWSRLCLEVFRFMKRNGIPADRFFGLDMSPNVRIVQIPVTING